MKNVIDTKFLETSDVKKKSPAKNVVIIRFVNKSLNELQGNGIFHTLEVVALLPDELKKKENVPI